MLEQSIHTLLKFQQRKQQQLKFENLKNKKASINFEAFFFFLILLVGVSSVSCCK